MLAFQIHRQTIHTSTPHECSPAYRFVFGHVSNVFWAYAVDDGHARQSNGFEAYPNKVDMSFIIRSDLGLVQRLCLDE